MHEAIGPNTTERDPTATPRGCMGVLCQFGLTQSSCGRACAGPASAGPSESAKGFLLAPLPPVPGAERVQVRDDR